MINMVLGVVLDEKANRVLVAEKVCETPYMMKRTGITRIVENDTPGDTAINAVVEVLRNCRHLEDLVTFKMIFSTVYAVEDIYLHVYAVKVIVNSYEGFTVDDINYTWHSIKYDTKVTDCANKSYNRGLILDSEDKILPNGVFAHAIRVAQQYLQGVAEEC